MVTPLHRKATASILHRMATASILHHKVTASLPHSKAMGRLLPKAIPHSKAILLHSKATRLRAILLNKVTAILHPNQATASHHLLKGTPLSNHRRVTVLLPHNSMVHHRNKAASEATQPSRRPATVRCNKLTCRTTPKAFVKP